MERVANVVSLREKYPLPCFKGDKTRCRNETDLRSEGGLISQGQSFVQLAFRFSTTRRSYLGHVVDGIPLVPKTYRHRHIPS